MCLEDKDRTNAAIRRVSEMSMMIIRMSDKLGETIEWNKHNFIALEPLDLFREGHLYLQTTELRKSWDARIKWALKTCRGYRRDGAYWHILFPVCIKEVWVLCSWDTEKRIFTKILTAALNTAEVSDCLTSIRGLGMDLITLNNLKVAMPPN